MKVGVDSYCFHRYFGEITPGLQVDPGRRMTVSDFVEFCDRLDVDGVSIETAFLDDTSAAGLRALRADLDARGLDRVWAWGHPRGLESGRNGRALDDLLANISVASAMGATVMRVVCGDRHTRIEPWADHRRSLVASLAPAVLEAERRGVVLAVENHKDLLFEELLDLMEHVDSASLGVCFDTGNNLRLFEDPSAGARLLAPWTRAVHAKDIWVQRGDPRTTRFWPTVPLGTGLVDIPRILDELQASSFDGLAAVETDYLHPDAPREHDAVEQSVRYLRGLLPRGGVVAAPRGRESEL